MPALLVQWPTEKRTDELTNGCTHRNIADTLSEPLLANLGQKKCNPSHPHKGHGGTLKHTGKNYEYWRRGEKEDHRRREHSRYA